MKKTPKTKRKPKKRDWKISDIRKEGKTLAFYLKRTP
jgi:hypothetical protein